MNPGDSLTQRALPCRSPDVVSEKGSQLGSEPIAAILGDSWIDVMMWMPITALLDQSPRARK
jgi:hypothetical protein